MELKEGYKQTEVGVIPEDWEVKKIGDVINRVEYGSSAKSKIAGKIPVLRMGNIQNGKFDFTDLVYTNNEDEIKKYLLEKDDVLFNRTNTVDLVGKTGIYKGEIPAIFAGYLIRINIKKELLNADYLNYWLNTRNAKNYGHLVLSVAVGQANINGAKLKTYPIPLPPTKTEQIAIATALSDADALITRLETLIAKKRAIKQGAMQQLLKPKDGWEVKSIGEFAVKIGSGKTPTGGERVYKREGRPFVRSQNIGWGELFISDMAFIDEQTHNSFLGTEIYEKDIFLNITGASIGRSSVADNRLIGGNVNQHVCIIQVHFKTTYHLLRLLVTNCHRPLLAATRRLSIA